MKYEMHQEDTSFDIFTVSKKVVFKNVLKYAYLYYSAPNPSMYFTLGSIRKEHNYINASDQTVHIITKDIFEKYIMKR